MFGWLENVLFIFVVIPVVVLLLHRLLRPVVEIGKYVEVVAWA